MLLFCSSHIRSKCFEMKIFASGTLLFITPPKGKLLESRFPLSSALDFWHFYNNFIIRRILFFMLGDSKTGKEQKSWAFSSEFTHQFYDPCNLQVLLIYDSSLKRCFEPSPTNNTNKHKNRAVFWNFFNFSFVIFLRFRNGIG